MLTSYLTILKRLPLKIRVKLCIFISLSLVGSLLELISFASLLPLISTLSSHYSEVLSLSILSFRFTIATPTILVLAFILFILSSLLRLFIFGFGNRLSANIGFWFSSVLFKDYLNKTYSEVISLAPGEVHTAQTTQLQQLIQSLNMIVSLVNSLMIASAIIIVLFFTRTNLTLVIALSLGLSYYIIAKMYSPVLKTLSKRIDKESRYLTNIINLTGPYYRNIIIDRSSEWLAPLFIESSKNLRYANATAVLIGSSPKYFLELIGLLSLFIATNLMLISGQKLQYIIPTLLLFLIALQKLLPAIQSIFSSWAAIQTRSNAIKKLALLLLDANNSIVLSTKSSNIFNSKSNLIHSVRSYPQAVPSQAISLSELELSSLTAHELTFAHPIYTSENIFENLNFTFNIGTAVAIKGPSGAGKSTLMNILMGIMKPTSGSVFMNFRSPTGAILSINLHNAGTYDSICRDHISFMSQDPTLLPLSLKDNVIMSRPFADPSCRMELPLRLAEVDSVIQAKILNQNTVAFTPDEIHNYSVGQAQRLSLSRTLYKQAPLIFLDEPTSSLDLATETRIASNLKSSYFKNSIIIFISHSEYLVSALADQTVYL